MMRRTACVMLLALSLLPILGQANAEDVYMSGWCGNNVQYVWYYDGRLVISGTGPMKDYVDEAPPWRRMVEDHLIIQNGVTSIGAKTFMDSYVWDADIASTVTRIGYDAFYLSADHEMSNGMDFALPASLEYIGSGAFYGRHLWDFVIPDTVTNLSGAFDGATGTLIAELNSNAAHVLSRAGYQFRQPDTNFSLRYLYTEDNEISEVQLRSVDSSEESFEIPLICNNHRRQCFFSV